MQPTSSVLRAVSLLLSAPPLAPVVAHHFDSHFHALAAGEGARPEYQGVRRHPPLNRRMPISP